MEMTTKQIETLNQAKIMYQEQKYLDALEQCLSIAEESGEAAWIIGSCYQFGRGLKQNDEKAIAWYKEAEALGEESAFLALGMIYGNQKKAHVYNPRQAIFYYEKVLAAGKTPRVYYLLGSMYLSGNGIEKNIKKAFDYFYEGSVRGNAECDLFLASCYENGNYLLQNTAKAISYYEGAARQGNAYARMKLQELKK